MNKYSKFGKKTQTDDNRYYAINKGRLRHVGTIRGRTYVKGLTYDGLLRLPELSATFGVDELAWVEERGADLFKIERSDTKETHSIEISKFKKYGEWTDRGHGNQIRCALHHFETVSKVKRNAALNNPPKETPGYQRPAQMSLFGDVVTFDKYGNYQG